MLTEMDKWAEILRLVRDVHCQQRHTKRCIFERLGDEFGQALKPSAALIVRFVEADRPFGWGREMARAAMPMKSRWVYLLPEAHEVLT